MVHRLTPRTHKQTASLQHILGPSAKLATLAVCAANLEAPKHLHPAQAMALLMCCTHSMWHLWLCEPVPT